MFTQSRLAYLAAFLGGGLLLIGSMLPWVDLNIASSDGFDEFRNIGLLDHIVGTEKIGLAGSSTTGLGLFGLGTGVLIFIVGLLTFAGLVERPFGIPQRLYFGTLGLTSILLCAAYLIDTTQFSDPAFNTLNEAIEEADISVLFDYGIGVWLSLVGALIIFIIGVMMNLIFLQERWANLLNNRDMENLNPLARITKCNLLNIGGLTLPAIVSAFALPYISELSSFADYKPTLLDRDFRALGIIVLMLLFLLLLLCLMSKSSIKPPADFFVLFSVPLLFVTSPFLLSGILFSTIRGGGAANWVIFICAIFIATISFRTVRNDPESCQT